MSIETQAKKWGSFHKNNSAFANIMYYIEKVRERERVRVNQTVVVATTTQVLVEGTTSTTVVVVLSLLLLLLATRSSG